MWRDEGRAEQRYGTMTRSRPRKPAALVDPATLPDLPVRAALPDIVAALDAHGAAVLVAPPGTGKTTLVPLALASVVAVSATRR